MPSPTCTVNSASPPQDVTASSTVTVALAAPAGAVYWFLTCVDADDTTSVATINASISINLTNKTATLTAPGSAGSAIILQSTVGVAAGSSAGAGLDANYQVQPSYTTTLKVNVPTTGGYHVLCTNEELEQSSQYGWIVEINAAIRAFSGAAAVVPAFQRLNANTTLATGSRGQVVLADTSAGSWTLKLPTGSSASDADEWTIVDSKGDWSTNALTLTTDVGTVPIVDPLGVGSSGDTANSLTLSSKRASVRVKYDKTQGLYLIC